MGTVFVAISYLDGGQSAKLILGGDPYQVRRGATDHALRQAIYAQKVVTDLRSEPAGERPVGGNYRLAVPEGGFALECPQPLIEASIAETRVCFAVEGNRTTKPARVALVALNGERIPEVLLAATNSEPTSQGQHTESGGRQFEVPRGMKLSLTWNRPSRHQ